MVVWWGYISWRGRGSGEDGGTDEHPLSDKPQLKRYGETFSGVQQKLLY